MHRVQENIQVEASADVAFRAWAERGPLPPLMEQTFATRWIAPDLAQIDGAIRGTSYAWTVKIEQIVQDHEISWGVVDALQLEGSVRFTPQGPRQTRVEIVIDYDTGTTPTVGGAAEAVAPVVRDTLTAFAEGLKKGRATATSTT